MEIEEARTVVRGALAGGSAFHALGKACRKFKEIMQAVEYRYQKVHACEPMEFAKAGDIKSWYGHLKAGRGCRVRRWEARSAPGTKTESFYGSLKRSVRGGGDVSLIYSTQPRLRSI